MASAPAPHVKAHHLKHDALARAIEVRQAREAMVELGYSQADIDSEIVRINARYHA